MLYKNLTIEQILRLREKLDTIPYEEFEYGKMRTLVKMLGFKDADFISTDYYIRRRQEQKRLERAGINNCWNEYECKLDIYL